MCPCINSLVCLNPVEGTKQIKDSSPLPVPSKPKGMGVVTQEQAEYEKATKLCEQCLT